MAALAHREVKAPRQPISRCPDLVFSVSGRVGVVVVL
jgi:hypothetical protein